MENDTNQTSDEPRQIVNPIAVQNCFIRFENQQARILDVSFVRIVVEDKEGGESIPDNEELSVELVLDRIHFKAQVKVRSKGKGWLRFGFEKIVPSARAHLRSFLSPKKVGESIVEDWRTDEVRHYHGLNESELWFHSGGGVLFTYLDQADPEYQFILRTPDSRGAITAGKIKREDYINLPRIDTELPLAPLSDREIVAKLGECRDIVTNFRPIGQMEYNLKQRLLRVISDQLYSTSHKVEMLPPRPMRPSVTISPEPH